MKVMEKLDCLINSNFSLTLTCLPGLGISLMYCGSQLEVAGAVVAVDLPAALSHASRALLPALSSAHLKIKRRSRVLVYKLGPHLTHLLSSAAPSSLLTLAVARIMVSPALSLSSSSIGGLGFGPR